VSELTLILASASPRRKDLLDAMGVEFDIHVTDIDETRQESEAAEDFVTRLAREKARAAQQARHQNLATIERC